MTPGTDLGFEAELFKVTDKLRRNFASSEHKHVALELIFLKTVGKDPLDFSGVMKLINGSLEKPASYLSELKRELK